MSTDTIDNEIENDDQQIEDDDRHVNIDNMVNHIIQGNNVEAKNIFGQLISRKVSDALDSSKYNISQQLFSREKE